MNRISQKVGLFFIINNNLHSNFAPMTIYEERPFITLVRIFCELYVSHKLNSAVLAIPS